MRGGPIAASRVGRLPRCAGVLLALVAPAALAKIEIEIPDVSRPVEQNIRGFLSLTRYADRDDVTAETMTRLQRRIVPETRDALLPLGYYEPEVSFDVTHEGDLWRVTLHVQPGRPVRLSEVSVNAIGPGENARPIREVIEADDLKPGLRLNHGTYEQVKGALLRAAKNDGYLEARFTKNELVIDRAERRANVTLELDTGPRYNFGSIKTDQSVINEESMRRLLRMHEGDPYTLDALLRTQYVLDDSQYFSVVDIESAQADRETHTVAVMVTAKPNRRHRYATSVGYGTDTKFRGKFTWDNRYVNKEGHRFKLELLGSSIITQASARYVIPVMDVALEKLEFSATATREELGDTLSQRSEVGTGLTQVFGRWQRVLFLKLSNETTTEATGEKNTANYIIPGISFSTMPSYIVGGKARPYRIYVELRGSPTTLGSDASFVQIRLQGERVYDFAEKWHLNLRAELGATDVGEASELPASQRFFAGGERSVRGFALNELSPHDEEGNSVGGRNLFSGSIELVRDLPKNFGVAAFYDTGNAFDNFSDPQLEYSVGVGLRYNIAVASFGVDVAQPLSEPGRNPRFSLYISTQF
jgi:translocation and assembly module TamA